MAQDTRLVSRDVLPGRDGTELPVVRVRHYLRWVVAAALALIVVWFAQVLITDRKSVV